MSSPLGFGLHVTIYIDAANLPKFFDYLKPVYEAVIAEPECRFFKLYQSPRTLAPYLGLKTGES